MPLSRGLAGGAAFLRFCPLVLRRLRSPPSFEVALWHVPEPGSPLVRARRLGSALGFSWTTTALLISLAWVCGGKRCHELGRIGKVFLTTQSVNPWHDITIVWCLGLIVQSSIPYDYATPEGLQQALLSMLGCWVIQCRNLGKAGWIG